MVPEDDARSTVEYHQHFAILPGYADEWGVVSHHRQNGGRPCADGFRYSSDTNTRWLTADELRDMISKETQLKAPSAS
jgi:UDP-N-acetylglucosamine 4,6-dehydratase